MAGEMPRHMDRFPLFFCVLSSRFAWEFAFENCGRPMPVERGGRWSFFSYLLGND